jgi:hypothetical protein
MLQLELKNWLLRSTCCTFLAAMAGFIYLYDSSVQLVFINQYWYQQPLLLIFVGMLVLALTLNLLSMFGEDFRTVFYSVRQRESSDLDSFNRLAQQFLQQQNASPVDGEANYYLQSEYGVLYYLQPQAKPAVDIVQLRHIFQQMLRLQCHSAFALTPDRIESPAYIFALEANIRLLDQQQLRSWIKAGKIC